MLVKYTPSTCSIIIAARDLEGKEGFSAGEVADHIGWLVKDVIDALDLHAEHGTCVRLDVNWSNSPTAKTKWCLIKISLTKGSIYEVLAIEGEYYRILSDANYKPCGSDPVLFHTSLFEIVDPIEPTFWQCTFDDDGERQCAPPDWCEPYFFERFHDGEEPIRKQFWRDIRRYYPRTAAERDLPTY